MSYLFLKKSTQKKSMIFYFLILFFPMSSIFADDDSSDNCQKNNNHHHNHHKKKNEECERGETGKRGQKGKDGECGEKGKDGEAGEKGKDGETGKNGQTGEAGKTGEMGPVGPPGSFPRDIGNTLTFSYTFAITLGTLTIGDIITPYVVLPDGSIHEGNIQSIVNGVNIIASVIIQNPEYGQYYAGLQLKSGTGALGGSLIIATINSREGNVISTLFFNGPINNALIGNQSQTTGLFTYGPDNIP